MDTRRAGILLHPTSLPGPLSNGDFGHEAYRFVEFISTCGFSVWQMLPLGPTHEDKSPYQCLSDHAGNPLLISLSWLSDRTWLDVSQLCGGKDQDSYRRHARVHAGKEFYRVMNDDWSHRLESFKQENSYWLDDFSLFIALITLSVIRALLPVTLKFAANSWFESNNIESTIGKIDIALFKVSFAINNINGTSEKGKYFSYDRISVFWQ